MHGVHMRVTKRLHGAQKRNTGRVHGVQMRIPECRSLATAQASSPPRPRVGFGTITSPRGALVGYGRIDTLLQGRGSSP